MNGTVFFISLMAVIAGILSVAAFQDDANGTGVFLIFLTGGMVWAASASWQSPQEKAEEAAKAQAQRTAEITPRKVSSADGCTVYTFKPGDRWLYFTKCENAQATTTNEYTVGSGKTARTETMEIKSK